MRLFSLPPGCVSPLREKPSKTRYGVLTPIIARQKDGGFEIISGHRRTYAAKQAGLKEVPVIVGQR